MSEWICCQIVFRSSVICANVYGLPKKLPSCSVPFVSAWNEVVERQPELLRELLDRDVVRVDQLAAVLVDLPVGEVAAAGPAASADPVRSLVDLRRVPRLLQAVGSRQPGETGADDDDPGRGERLAPQPAGRRRRAARRLRAPSPAPASSWRLVVRASSSAIFETASSTAFASGVRAISAPPRVDVDSLNVMHSTCSRKPRRPGEHGEQCDEHQIAQPERRRHSGTRAHSRSSAAGTRPASGSAPAVRSAVAARPRRPRTSGTSGSSQIRYCGESTLPKTMNAQVHAAA